MSKTRNLTECDVEQLRDFLDSFDVILCDCDGVLWNLESVIEGAIESLDKLRCLGKEVFFVTNNSVLGIDYFLKKLKRFGFDAKPEQIINTAKVIAWYLKKIDFQGEAFVIGSPVFRKILVDSGIKLIQWNQKDFSTPDISTILKTFTKEKIVKAVITDFDVECDWPKLAFAISCLNRNDVLYVSGAADEWIVFGPKKILGCGALLNLVSKYSERVPIACGKPSKVLMEYIFEICNLSDPRRCVFVGDTIKQDMKFGSLCNFVKLLVSTGCDNLEDAQKEKDTCPDYYLPSLGQLLPLIDGLSITRSDNVDDS